MGASPQETVFFGLTFYLVLLFSLSVHESAHAWVAARLGDDTAMRLGRISLNPMVHIDPIGTVLIPLVAIFTGAPLFGWAKPVPVMPQNFRRYSLGNVLVSAAGPVSNMLLVIFFLGWLAVTLRLVNGGWQHPLPMLGAVGVQLNVLLAVFNLLPLPPLDGSKIASFGLPRDLALHYDRVMEPFGPWLLLLFIISPLWRWISVPIWSVTVFLIQLVS